MTRFAPRVSRVCLLAFCLVTFGAVRSAPAQPAPPILEAPVNDLARVIDAASAEELDRRIRALQKSTGDVVAIATVPTFKPYADIREYAVKMFENGGRGIGEKGKDNGLLIVLAVEDRRVDIEVGYALEEFVTDSFAGETIRQYMTPEFRNGNYGAGLLAATTRIINRIAERRGVNLQDVPQSAPVPSGGGGSNFPWISLIVILIILAAQSRRRRGRNWGGGGWSGWSSGIGPFGGGGGFGGGFGGFGGGGGGGGGGGFGG
ncbi:MAG: TPM domain-containing protein, partial [Acidobacteriota bacterium]